MHLKLITPKQSLNKAYLKEKISRADIELFKGQFTALLDKINTNGDEEHLKSLIADFLKLTWYNNSQHQINPIAKNDLVIHTGKSPNDPYAAILEVKRPNNTPEMISVGNPNLKAFHELVLYYLDERITNNRNELKQLIITNIYQWYIIDANEFDKKIYRNTAIKKLYELKKTDGKDNPWFYDELKKLLAANKDFAIEATFFDLRDYKKILLNTNTQDDKGLIALYKILSPVHILKLPFANDSNTLQPKFYSELLHLIGLYEYKEGSKKLISRKKDGERNAGSLLENAIVQLDSHDKISRLDKPSQYGETYQERLYTVALELVITWINRILFLKLLEAQLINYHKGDRSYTFLNKDKIRDFDDLDKLFFRVLAKVPAERSEDIQKLFGKVPYLNSSLFEPTDLEHQTLFINGLEDFVPLPIINATVLKDANSKVLKGNLNTLDYLFAFLNAYDFSSEGAEEIQEDNKTLINASVLGLIFEKINGYKDGSFFTPGFITMYMCRETIRRAVVQKFNEAKEWACKEYAELYDKIEDKKEANIIINSLKICDPAVGSGHFLVSALNEVLAIKSDLKILLDKDGRTLRDYNITVENDELIVTDVDADIFEYNPKSKESQRIQETLFHEKQTIIENCLFGVDINPNSVKICRLRLWIELLKNAYYKANGAELETLPNIDINIKVGNSLISRFTLDADLKQALKNTKWNINDYKIAVGAYKNATNKAEKRELVTLIDSIKTNFRSSISRNSKELKDIAKFEIEYNSKYNSSQLFENKLSKKQRSDKLELENKIYKLKNIVEEIKTNKIYENAFEWRFEFPEVLDENGEFVGFDIILGNPPYIQQRKSNGNMSFFKEKYSVYSGTADISVFFFERAFTILKDEGQFGFINTNKFFNTEYGKPLREFLATFYMQSIVNFELVPIFDEALVSSVIIIQSKSIPINKFSYTEFRNEKVNYDKFNNELMSKNQELSFEMLLNKSWLFHQADKTILIEKIQTKGSMISENPSIEIKRGVTTGFDDAFVVANDKLEFSQNEYFVKPLLRGRDIHRYLIRNQSYSLLFIPWHFPLNDNKQISGASLEAEKALQTRHPILFNHLNNYKTSLLNRNKEETGIRYEWYALQRCASSYFELFDQDKIVWGLISGGWDFGFDNKRCYLSSASFFLVSHEIPLKIILGLLNSKLYKFYFSIVGELTAGGAYVFKKTTIEKFIIPKSWKQHQSIIHFVDDILSSKHNGVDSIEIEKELDSLIYKIFDLTSEEIKIIESLC